MLTVGNVLTTNVSQISLCQFLLSSKSSCLSPKLEVTLLCRFLLASAERPACHLNGANIFARLLLWKLQYYDALTLPFLDLVSAWSSSVQTNCACVSGWSCLMNLNLDSWSFYFTFLLVLHDYTVCPACHLKVDILVLLIKFISQCLNSKGQD